jgi:hypothetical protein
MTPFGGGTACRHCPVFHSEFSEVRFSRCVFHREFFKVHFQGLARL